MINFENDYRQAAIEASSQLVEINGSLPQSPSVCVANALDPSKKLMWLRRFVLLRFIGGILLMIDGGICVNIYFLGNQNGTFLTIGIACSLGGFMMLLSNAYFQTRLTRKIIANRYYDLVSISTEFTPICVAIEDSQTFARLKVLPEDLGYLGLDSRNGRVLIEGIHCRYSICAADVINISLSQGVANLATEVSYHAAGVPLSIAIQYDGIVQKSNKNSGASKSPLMDWIRETLNFET